MLKICRSLSTIATYLIISDMAATMCAGMCGHFSTFCFRLFWVSGHLTLIAGFVSVSAPLLSVLNYLFLEPSLPDNLDCLELNAPFLAFSSYFNLLLPHHPLQAPNAHHYSAYFACNCLWGRTVSHVFIRLPGLAGYDNTSKAR